MRTILNWTVYTFAHFFTHLLPIPYFSNYNPCSLFFSLDGSWNTPACFRPSDNSTANHELIANHTTTTFHQHNITKTPVEEFWERRVLNQVRKKGMGTFFKFIKLKIYVSNFRMLALSLAWVTCSGSWPELCSWLGSWFTSSSGKAFTHRER